MQRSIRQAGQRITLMADPAHVAVRPAAGQDDRLWATLAARDLTRDAALDAAGLDGLHLLQAGPAAAPGRRPSRRMAPCLRSLAARRDVAAARPVFRLGNMLLIPRGRLHVTLEPGADADAVAQRLGLRLLEKGRPDAPWLLMAVPRGSCMFAAARRAARLPQVAAAVPDCSLLRPAAASSPKAAGCPQPHGTAPGYHLGQIAAQAGWAVQPGLPSITIAILDNGVDAAHPDLAGALAVAHDVANQPPHPQPDAPLNHGTACAGLAGGMGAGPQGVVGAAHGCRLMSVRMTRLATDGQLDVTDAQLMADAIRWAADNGADVISFSWDAGWSMPALAAAIRHARSNGRGGLGCVIVAAAGNRGIGMVDYPAREDGVLAVAAVGPDDEPVEDACAGDGRQWGSNWGPELAVAAPGLWLRTTDNRGGNGVAAGDYSEDFGGTSAATPLVAAACALILCRNPGLRESEVRAIICNSADKVGSWTYDNSGHSRGLGYGRLNLGQALTMTPTP